MKTGEPFQFYTRLNQTELLGRRAHNLIELLEGIKDVPDSSIYHHTHRFLQRYHYMTPVTPNDFAAWITDVLNEDSLGEIIASVDIVEFKEIRELRERFILLLNNFLQGKEKVRECPDNEEFHFMACKSFIFPLPYRAHTLEEFRELLGEISVHSLYFHIFESRLRLGRIDNDFSKWLRGLGEDVLAAEISRLDPYSYNLEALRKKILAIVNGRKAGRV